MWKKLPLICTCYGSDPINPQCPKHGWRPVTMTDDDIRYAEDERYWQRCRDTVEGFDD